MFKSVMVFNIRYLTSYNLAFQRCFFVVRKKIKFLNKFISREIRYIDLFARMRFY